MSEWLKEAERRSDESAEYGDWVDRNEEFIVEQYSCDITDFPDDIYEGFLDDDYEDAERHYLENLEIEDVPDEYVQRKYEEYLEGDE